MSVSVQVRRFFAVDSSAAQQAATWCHCETGGLVAYVQGYNVFLLDVPSGQRTQVTTDGTPDGRVRNGIADWVYEVRAPFRTTATGFRILVETSDRNSLWRSSCLAPLA
eukprot:COSAG04_NODE_4894_length_1837_cov_1.617376_1_plen_109_part_00